MDYGSHSAEEVFLACLRAGSEPAWEEFLNRFQPLLLGVIIKIAGRWGEHSRQVVDELLQETYLKLCYDRESILKSFRPTHQDSVYGFLKVFAANLAHDHFKTVYAKKRGGSYWIQSTEDCSSAFQSLAASDPRIERNVLVKEVEAIVRDLAPGPNGQRDRTIFWLYYRSGLSASSIALIPAIGLTTKGVESTLQRLTAQLKNRIFRTDASMPGASHEGKGKIAGDSF